MGFKRITIMDIYEIIRRWHDNQNISEIGRALQFDRKTIRQEIDKAKKLGISRDIPLPSKYKLLQALQEFKSPVERAAPSQSVFLPYVDEIKNLINCGSRSLKPKIAFELIRDKYNLKNTSYSAFKRFMRKQPSLATIPKTTCSIERLPGREVQIDYGYMGLLFDPVSNRKRKVYAFIATLPHSKHKFVHFTFSLSQQNFVAAHVEMFEYFGGVPYRLNIDNLKTGVIKADRYDPTLNRAYAECAEYYGCFIDPCRIAHAQDKPSVERDVRTIREQFKRLCFEYPDLLLDRANRELAKWLIQVYGERNHGTTHQKPYQVFKHIEQPVLKSLPLESFDIPLWKSAIVHADQFVQINQQFFSVPQGHVGATVWLRASGKVLQVFLDHILIKQHVITSQTRHTDTLDFPENKRIYLNTGAQLKIQHDAEILCPPFRDVIRAILEPDCFLNLRKAMAMVREARKYPLSTLYRAVEFIQQKQIVMTYQGFKRLLQNLNTPVNESALPISQQTMDFIRDMSYYSHNSIRKGDPL